MLLSPGVRPLLHSSLKCHNCLVALRTVSTLPNNSHIYVHPTPTRKSGHILSLLPTSPPTRPLSIGTTTQIPPTPSTFTENIHFLPLLYTVLSKHVYFDPLVQASASTFASPGGATILSAKRRQGTAVSPGGTGAGGANTQGGAGGGGVGGWIHVYDLRSPPAYGRVPDPQDIFGSVKVDGEGKIQEGGWEECRAYRIVTNEGILGLSEYLREKLVERLIMEEKRLKA